MARNFSKYIKQDCVYGVTTTTAATYFGDQVDCANYEGVLITATFKSTAGSTGTAVFTVVGTDTSTAASTSYTALNGASITVTKSTAANAKRIASIDCYRPQYRYLKAKVVKTARLLQNSIVAQKYNPRVEPAEASTTYAGASAALSKVLCVEAT